MYSPLFSTSLMRLFRGHTRVPSSYSLCKLQPRQSLFVRYEPAGPLPHVVYHFEFTDHQVVLYDAPRSSRLPRTPLGSCELSDADLRELDQIFLSCERCPADDPAQADTIQFTLKSGDRRLHSRTFVCPSCGCHHTQAKSSLERLAHRVRQSRKNAVTAPSNP